MPLALMPVPELKTVAQASRAPDAVEALVRRYNRDHRNGPQMTVRAVTRLGIKRTTIATVHKFGTPLDVTIEDDSEACVIKALDVLARAAESDAPVTHLFDPGKEGKNMPAPVQDAPREGIRQF